MDVFIDHHFGSFYDRHPLTLVDIGASGGLQRHWYPARKHLKVIAFEPDRRAGENSPRMFETVYVNSALSNTKMTVPFYLGRKQAVSSMFRPNRSFLERFPESERFDIVKEQPIAVDTLDHQLTELQANDVDFVKIDAQGSELAILEGAEHTLNESVFGVEVEVEFAPVYENQPLFQDVNNFLSRQGFQLFDLRPYYWKRKVGVRYGHQKGQIIFGDALYFRSPDRLMEIVKCLESSDSQKSKVLRVLSVCLLFGYIDYALELLEQMGAFLDGSEQQLIERSLKSQQRLYRFIPDFRGRGKIASALHKLWKLIRPTHRGWALHENSLGNR